MEKQLEDQLREIKRQGLLERLALENEQTNITGKQGNQNQITNNISDLETDQKVADTKSMGLISDAEMKDFEAKFGGFTSRLSNLWDQGIQSLMNGTSLGVTQLKQCLLTWEHLPCKQLLKSCKDG